MGRKAVSRKKQQPQFDDSVVIELPTSRRRKRWSEHDLKSIKAMNPRQADFLHGWFEGNNVCAYGSAGSGKSYLAVYAALAALFDSRDSAQRIIIVRSAVSTRDIGFLPGKIEEKQQPFEQPYVDILEDLVGRASTYQDMVDAGAIEFVLTSHVRGLTWDNAVVIIDEAQNMTFHEINSVITRLGKGSRVIVAGDTKQTDLVKNSRDTEGFTKAINILTKLGATIVCYQPEDIVRSGFVRSWLIACEDT